MNVVWIIFLFIFGACIGSFLNVVIYRLPRGESIVVPPSHCPSCGRGIRWYDNIPLLSWLALGARCRDCHAPISSRYFIIEAATAIRVAGLFVLYYVVRVRGDAGVFEQTWPAYVSHAALLCGLLACSVVDIEQFIIPLEVMWFCAVVGVAAGAVAPLFASPSLPHPLMTTAGPEAIAYAVAGGVGVLISLALLRWGFLQPSFIDAARGDAQPAPSGPVGKSKNVKAKPAAAAQPKTLRLLPRLLWRSVIAAALGFVPGTTSQTVDAAGIPITAGGGVNPRREMLRELLFLAPAFVLAGAVWFVFGLFPAVADTWSSLLDSRRFATMGPVLTGLGSALFGYMIGGLWIWGTRILGTLAFGKEAMGMGDVHILAAVGAVSGWIVPSVTFFVAPVIGLGWALYLWITKKQPVLAYGPWLAAGALVTLVFHDWFIEMLQPILGGY